jgi:hypothetical protein
MTDREYVESTVAYLAEHVPRMWHKFAAWMLREICKDQSPECLAVADLHDRWEDVTEKEFAAARNAAGSTARSAARNAAWSTARNAAWSAAWSAARNAARSAARSTAGSAAWSTMANWLRSELHTKTDPLVSADWWEERGERKLADLLRQQNEVNV